MKPTIAASLSDSTELMLESLRMCGDAGNEVATVGSLTRMDKRRKMGSFLECFSGFGDGIFGDGVLGESRGEKIEQERVGFFISYVNALGRVSLSSTVVVLLRDVLLLDVSSEST